MKKIAGILSLLLCLATFFMTPSALADVSPVPVITSSPVSVPVLDENDPIWKLSSPTFTSQGGTVYHGHVINPKLWNLQTGTGLRKFVTHVYFEEPYQNLPTVTVSLTGLNTDKLFNQRIVVKPINITLTGFDLEFTTWADSQVYSVWSNWTAFGNNA